MNKAFYIVSLCLSFVFIFVCSYYVSEVQSARYMYFDFYNSTGADSLTEEAGLVSLLFFLWFIVTDILGLIKIKRTTTKVLSIISLSLGGVFLFWDFGMMSSPGALSFDEVGPAFILFSLVILAFSIVGIIQSTRFAREKSGKGTLENSDLLDS